MFKILAFCFLCGNLLATGEPSVDLPVFQSEGLARIAPAMQQLVDEDKVAGVSTLIIQNGKELYRAHVGRCAPGRAATNKTIWRMYSMTKPVTAAAVMILVDQGKIGLDDPIAKYLPEFAKMRVYDSVENDIINTVPANKAITVRHLLMHTSGFTYGYFGRSPVDLLYLKDHPLNQADLPTMSVRLAELPLVHQPGEGWTYGVSLDVAGYLVQVVSGMPFETFMEKKIFKPLGMKDSGFWVPRGSWHRLAVVYELGEKLVAKPDHPPYAGFLVRPNLPSGGGGMVSTIDDYSHFASMLFDGTYKGKRILSEESARSIRTDHLPDALKPARIAGRAMHGFGFGLGGSVVVDIEATGRPGHNGIYRWAGMASTSFWVDPQAKLVAVLCTNHIPYGNPPLERLFQKLTYEAMK